MRPVIMIPLVAASLFLLSDLSPIYAQSSGTGSGTELEGLPIRTITIHGLVKMDEDVVRRRLELKEGEPYHDALARRDERAITSLMTFWSVRISAIGFPAESPRAVDVHVRIRERFAWFAAPQILWSPEEGWSYGLYGGHINVARRGHRLYFYGITGGARYLKVSLHNPWNGPNHESFAIDGSVVRIRNKLYGSKESGERLGLKLGRWFGRSGRCQVGFLYRRIEGTTPWYAPSPDTNFQDSLHMLWLVLGRDTSDPWEYPSVGHSANIRLEQCGGLLGGNISGGTAGAVVSRKDRVSGSLVLAGLLTFNNMWGDNPFWRLLTLGGANSLRGYPLGHYLITRRWEITGELQWYAVPMHIVSLGALGDQIVGASFSLFIDAGAGSGIRRRPDSGLQSGRTPVLVSGGLGCYLHNALFGSLRIEMAWPEHGPRQFIFGLGTKF